MKKEISNKRILVTGAVGFIGFHVSKKFLENGCEVIGIDSFSDYYDVSLKEKRYCILKKYKNFKIVKGKLEEPELLKKVFGDYKPSHVIHLAAQAGVRHSIENPRIYLESNVVGTFELLEASSLYPPKHLIFASTSSVYGSNKTIPFSENDKADYQLSFYAATKKATENLAHSFAHLHNVPMTGIRFFTVYGPWGRPDMALFKFTKAIIEEKPIKVYNNGDMKRDFTYIEDLVGGIVGLIDKIPFKSKSLTNLGIDGSPVAPFRVINMGNSTPISLMDFISAIEKATGKKAIKEFLPMQPGEVPVTWSDNKKIKKLIGYESTTDVSLGVSHFVQWYKEYYQ